MICLTLVGSSCSKMYLGETYLKKCFFAQCWGEKELPVSILPCFCQQKGRQKTFAPFGSVSFLGRMEQGESPKSDAKLSVFCQCGTNVWIQISEDEPTLDY